MKVFRTGDLARIENSLIFYEGRQDSQIKIRGQKIDLTEIDRAILEISSVAAVVTCCKINDYQQVRNKYDFFLKLLISNLYFRCEIVEVYVNKVKYFFNLTLKQKNFFRDDCEQYKKISSLYTLPITEGFD